jgi:hypothetical protein
MPTGIVSIKTDAWREPVAARSRAQVRNDKKIRLLRDSPAHTGRTSHGKGLTGKKEGEIAGTK